MLRGSSAFFKNKFSKIDLGVVRDAIGQLPKRKKLDLDLTEYQYCQRSDLFYKVWDKEPKKPKSDASKPKPRIK